jgi:hypothetical protein
MAPEQARDTRQASPASDVFSLGSTLAYAATGHPPYRGETVTDVLLRLATEPPDLTGLPPDLAGVVTGCLESEPANRPTPAALLAAFAPDAHLDADGPPSLPGPAQALMEDYRQRPRGPSRVDEEDDRTLGSRLGGTDSAGSSASWSVPVARWAAASGSEPPPVGTPPAAAPAAGSGPAAGRGSTAPPRRRGPLPAALLAVAAVALLAAGAVLGGWLSGLGPPVPGPQPSAAGPPPEREPPPPPGGASERPTGPPTVQVNQPYGDGHTVFVVHGRGWAPGTRLTVALAGGPTSPDRPVVDKAGTFNYAVNQRHEFFAGALPPGVHTVVVSAPGGRTEPVSFRVEP